MDSITHIVFGAVTGSAIAGKKLGKKALLWGALANSIPDIDVITRFWMNDPDAMLAHRGFTHSLLFAFLLSPILSWLFVKYNSNKSMLFRDWMMIFLSGMLFHILIDCMTTYGTGLFEPFSHVRISFNNIFVADPFFTIWFLIPFVALLIIKKDSLHRKFWFRFGILMGSIYILYTGVNKFRFNASFKSFFAEHNISTEKYFCAPAPLNNWLWMAMAKDKDSLYIAYCSVFDKAPIRVYQSSPVNDNLLDAVRNAKDVQTVLRLSKGYYCVTKSNDSLLFSDARFGVVNAWGDEIKRPEFVFNFDILQRNDSVLVQQGKFRPIIKESFKQLIERVKGKE